jgi:hypothetical protein
MWRYVTTWPCHSLKILLSFTARPTLLSICLFIAFMNYSLQSFISGHSHFFIPSDFILLKTVSSIFMWAIQIMCPIKSNSLHLTCITVSGIFIIASVLGYFCFTKLHKLQLASQSIKQSLRMESYLCLWGRVRRSPRRNLSCCESMCSNGNKIHTCP